MGSKRVKAIAVRGTKPIIIKDDKFREAAFSSRQA
jgi:aldehyde:ferredoxin oxidoreductase